MDCCICSAYILRLPRNTICATCYQGAKSLLSLLDKPEFHTDEIANDDDSLASKANSNKTLMTVWRCATAMKDYKEELDEKIKFLGGLVTVFKDQIHTDIILKPANNGPPIPAHKALLAARSEIFKNMLDSDTCKADTQEGEVVTLTEPNHYELESLLEFLYSGSLPKDVMKEHVLALSLAADKYNIPYLRTICERHITNYLSPLNALDAFEISHICSYQGLKDIALKLIIKNMEEIVFSSVYEAFALKNPHLCTQIIRATFKHSQRNELSREEKCP